MYRFTAKEYSLRTKMTQMAFCFVFFSIFKYESFASVCLEISLSLYSSPGERKKLKHHSFDSTMQSKILLTEECLQKCSEDD